MLLVYKDLDTVFLFNMMMNSILIWHYYAGTVQEKNLVDMNIGFVFGTGLSLDISGTNVFDQKYRSFPGYAYNW